MESLEYLFGDLWRRHANPDPDDYDSGGRHGYRVSDLEPNPTMPDTTLFRES